MDCKIQSDIRIEQSEVDLEYPAADSSAIKTFTEGQIFERRNIKTHSGIKVEQPKVDLKCSKAQGSTKETATEGQTAYEMDIQVPAVVNTEQPEDCLDYAEMLPSSQSDPSSSTQECLQTEMFHTTNSKPVKQGLTGALWADKTHRFGSILDMTINSSFQELMINSNTDPAKTESDYTVLFKLKKRDHSSENMSALTKVNKNLSLNNENSLLFAKETEVNNTYISRGSLDSYLDSANSMCPSKQTAYLTDGRDKSSNVEKERQNVEKPYKQHAVWWSEECTEARIKRKRALQKYRRFGSTENWDNYRALRNATNRIVRKAKEAYWKTFCENLNPDTSATEA